jgi:hypothetical protein
VSLCLVLKICLRRAIGVDDRGALRSDPTIASSIVTRWLHTTFQFGILMTERALSTGGVALQGAALVGKALAIVVGLDLVDILDIIIITSSSPPSPPSSSSSSSSSSTTL